MLFEKYKEYKQVNEVLPFFFFLKWLSPRDNKYLLYLQSTATSLQKNKKPLKPKGNLIFQSNKYSF